MRMDMGREASMESPKIDARPPSEVGGSNNDRKECTHVYIFFSPRPARTPNPRNFGRGWSRGFTGEAVGILSPVITKGSPLLCCTILRKELMTIVIDGCAMGRAGRGEACTTIFKERGQKNSQS